MIGQRLLHPVSLAATALYGFNDWWLKENWSGLLSGKLSDVAGMVVLPLTLHTLAEIVLQRELSSRWLLAMILVSAVGFSAVEVSPLASAAWCWTWGAMQWPFYALASIGSEIPPVRPVVAWSDPTDLLTVPFGLLALLTGTQRSSNAQPDSDAV